MNALQLDLNANATKKEMPAWPGLLPLSLCTMIACERSLQYNFQEQRLALYPVKGNAIDGPMTLLPRKDILVNSDEKKYTFKLREGFRLTRSFMDHPSGKSYFFQVVEPTQRESTCVVIWFLGTELVADSYLPIAQHLAKDFGFVTVIVDWESFGRSSGLYYYTPDLDGELARIVDVLGLIVPPLIAKRDPALKVFVRGDGVGSIRAVRLARRGASKFNVHGLILAGFSTQLSDDFLTVPLWIAKVMAQVGTVIHPLWPLAPVEELGDLSIRNWNELHDFFQHDVAFSLRDMRTGVLEDYLMGDLHAAAGEIKELTIPILGIFAGDDKVAPVEESMKIFQHIPSDDVEFFKIEGALHAEVMFFNMDGKVDSTENAFHFETTPEQKAIASQAENKFIDWIQARL